MKTLLRAPELILGSLRGVLPAWLPAWALPLMVVMAVGTVWLRLSIVRTTYMIDQTEQMITNAKHERERARLKLTELRSPARLQSLAKDKFQLKPPKQGQVVRLR